MGLIDLFIGGGKQEPSLAMTLTNLKYKGTIIDSSGLRGFELYTPGSKWRDNIGGGNTAAQPYYDNPLGIFSLLNTPVVKYKRSNSTVPVAKFTRLLYSDQPNNTPLESSSAYVDQLNLKIDGLDDIDYAVNPASGLEVTGIKGSLIINTTGSVLSNQAEYVSDFNGGYYYNNINPPPSQRPGVGTFGYIGYSGVNVYEEKTPNQFADHKFVIQTPPMSLDCIKNYVAKIGFVGGKLTNTSDIRLQIMATLKRKDNPNAKEVIFINEYKVNLIEDTGLNQATELTKIPIATIVENLTLNQDLTIRAWDVITVKGNINTNGFKLTIIAGGEIKIENQSVFNNPNIELLIGTPDQCTGFKQPVDATKLTAFCGTKYNPNSSAFLKASNNEEKAKQATYGLSINPNPFLSQFTVNFEIAEETKVDIELFNTLGQRVSSIASEKREIGNHQITFDGKDLAPGIYFLTLRTKNGIETKKIVKRGE